LQALHDWEAEVSCRPGHDTAGARARSGHNAPCCTEHVSALAQADEAAKQHNLFRLTSTRSLRVELNGVGHDADLRAWREAPDDHRDVLVKTSDHMRLAQHKRRQQP